MKKPKPLCPLCMSHRRRCECGKYMKVSHVPSGALRASGPLRCTYTCKCGREHIVWEATAKHPKLPLTMDGDKTVETIFRGRAAEGT